MTKGGMKFGEEPYFSFFVKDAQGNIDWRKPIRTKARGISGTKPEAQVQLLCDVFGNRSARYNYRLNLFMTFLKSFILTSIVSSISIDNIIFDSQVSIDEKNASKSNVPLPIGQW